MDTKIVNHVIEIGKDRKLERILGKMFFGDGRGAHVLGKRNSRRVPEMIQRNNVKLHSLTLTGLEKRKGLGIC